MSCTCEPLISMILIIITQRNYFTIIQLLGREQVSILILFWSLWDLSTPSPNKFKTEKPTNRYFKQKVSQPKNYFFNFGARIQIVRELLKKKKKVIKRSVHALGSEIFLFFYPEDFPYGKHISRCYRELKSILFISCLKGRQQRIHRRRRECKFLGKCISLVP